MARRKFSEYALRLKEKQKLLLNYGLREEQLRRFAKKAKGGRASDWMAVLIGMLESRLDNVVFRLGFAPSIPAARQLVGHGKVRVNGKKVTISSASVKVGDEITLTPKAFQTPAVQMCIGQPRLLVADWFERSQAGEGYVGRLKMIPPKDAVPFPFEARLVAEYYTGV